MDPIYHLVLQVCPISQEKERPKKKIFDFFSENKLTAALSTLPLKISL